MLSSRLRGAAGGQRAHRADRRGVPRLGQQDGLVQLPGLVRAIAARCERAEAEQRVHVAGIGRADFPVERLGAGEVRGLEGRPGLAELREQRIGGRAPGDAHRFGGLRFGAGGGVLGRRGIEPGVVGLERLRRLSACVRQQESGRRRVPRDRRWYRWQPAPERVAPRGRRRIRACPLGRGGGVVKSESSPAAESARLVQQPGGQAGADDDHGEAGAQQDRAPARPLLQAGRAVSTRVASARRRAAGCRSRERGERIARGAGAVAWAAVDSGAGSDGGLCRPIVHGQAQFDRWRGAVRRRFDGRVGSARLSFRCRMSSSELTGRLTSLATVARRSGQRDRRAGEAFLARRRRRGSRSAGGTAPVRSCSPRHCGS